MIRDGETGLLAPPCDPAGLARAVRALLAEPDRAVAFARRARAAVEAHAWPRVAQGWAAVYAGAAA
jgi:glycosyltransferase involved in cell wall biosynthesis